MGRVLRGEWILTHRKCATCRHYADAGFAGSGWCRHPDRERDALVMVRKNELGCNQGWKKDLWEPLADGERLPGPPVVTGLHGPASGAEFAATVMRVCPLDDQDSPETSSVQDREDVVVGEQPIMRGFDQRRSQPALEDGRAVDLSRDPGEAIRRAHEVFREHAAQRPRREELTALLKPDVAAEERGAKGNGEANRLPEATSLDTGVGSASDEANGGEREEADDSTISGEARPSRWHLRVPAPADGIDDRLDSEEPTGTTSSGEGRDTTPLQPLPSPPADEPFFSTEQRSKRWEQPASLARHRWPPRTTSSPGLFPPRDMNADFRPRSTERGAPPVADAAAPEVDARISPPVETNRREWQERWSAKSLLRGGVGDANPSLPADEDAEANEPMLSHRVPEWSDQGTEHDGVGGTGDSTERTARGADDRAGDQERGRTSRVADQDVDGAYPREAVAPEPHGRERDDRVAAAEDERGTTEAAWMAGVPRVCMTCRDFRPAESGERGWCTNDWAFSHRTMVAADDRPCQTAIGSWWLPHESIWLEPVDMQGHGFPTPLIDTYLSEPKERVARRRS